jgi:hypothetical protein
MAQYRALGGQVQYGSLRGGLLAFKKCAALARGAIIKALAQRGAVAAATGEYFGKCEKRGRFG